MKRFISIILIIIFSFIMIIPANAENFYEYAYYATTIYDGDALLSKVVVSSVTQSSTDPQNIITVTVKLTNLNETYLNDVMVGVSGLSADTLSLINTFGPFETDFKAKDSSYVTFDLFASPKIKGGNYPLTLTLTYVDNMGDTVSVNRSISILIEKEEVEVNKAAPLVIVSSYDIDKESIVGGDNFTLTFTIKNTSGDKNLSNVLISFSSESNAFTPNTGSSNQVYIDNIDAGGSYTGKIKLDANSMIAGGFYNLIFNVQYQDEFNSTYLTSAQIGLQLEQEEEEVAPTPLPLNIPYVVVSSYEIDKEKLFPGDEFELTLTLLNTSSDQALNNVMLSYSSASNAFVPTTGASNQLYVGNISAGGSYTGKLKIKSDKLLTKGDYSLKLNLMYQDTDKKSYTSAADITITLEEEQKLNISIISIADTCILGSKALLSISYENPGQTELKNVSVNLKGNISADEKTIPIGTVKAGYSSFIDQYITPDSLGLQNIEISFSFEDDDGNTYQTASKVASITVISPSAEETPEISPTSSIPTDNAGQPEKSNGTFLNSISVYLIIAGVILALAAVALGFFMLKKKKKEKAEWK